MSRLQAVHALRRAQRVSLGGRWFAQALIVIVIVFLPLSSVAAQTTFDYYYDAKGQLVKVVDSAGNVIEYVYDSVGNMLEVRRSTVSGLAIFGFTPAAGAVGTQVTIRGQGFDVNPANDVVRFNGMAATVTSATTTAIVTTVPAGATTGAIAVTVGGLTAMSDGSFAVIDKPVVESVTPTVALAGTSLGGFQVQGHNLVGSTFHFEPAFVPPAITVSSSSIAPDGASATLNIGVAPAATGGFVVVATNSQGSSESIVIPPRTLRVLLPSGDEDLDGLTNAEEVGTCRNPFEVDTDGDGFGDGEEVGAGSDPCNATSLPVNPTAVTPYVVSAVFAILNNATPPEAIFTRWAEGLPFSVLNEAVPPEASYPRWAEGLPFSALNEVVPPEASFTRWSEGLPFSILNEVPPSEASFTRWSESLPFSILNSPSRAPTEPQMDQSHRESEPKEKQGGPGDSHVP